MRILERRLWYCSRMGYDFLQVSVRPKFVPGDCILLVPLGCGDAQAQRACRAAMTTLSTFLGLAVRVAPTRATSWRFGHTVRRRGEGQVHANDAVMHFSRHVPTEAVAAVVGVSSGWDLYTTHGRSGGTGTSLYSHLEGASGSPSSSSSLDGSNGGSFISHPATDVVSVFRAVNSDRSCGLASSFRIHPPSATSTESDDHNAVVNIALTVCLALGMRYCDGSDRDCFMLGTPNVVSLASREFLLCRRCTERLVALTGVDIRSHQALNARRQRTLEDEVRASLDFVVALHDSMSNKAAASTAATSSFLDLLMRTPSTSPGVASSLGGDGTPSWSSLGLHKEAR
eukprot:PhM_4_TR8053/c0_g1_i1/m.53600